MFSKVQAIHKLNAFKESKARIGLFLHDREFFVQEHCNPIQNEIDIQTEKAYLHKMSNSNVNDITTYKGTAKLPEARSGLLKKLEKFKERCRKPFTQEEQCALDRLKESVDSLKLDYIREEPEQNEAYWILALKQIEDTNTELNRCIDAIKWILLGFSYCAYDAENQQVLIVSFVKTAPQIESLFGIKPRKCYCKVKCRNESTRK